MPEDWKRIVLIYLFVFVVGLIGAISDALLNQWAKTDSLWWLLGAYLSWFVVATLLGFLLKWQFFTFSGAVVLFLLVNSVGAIVIDTSVFGERLTVWQWVGMAFAIAGMCCIEIGRAQSHEEKSKENSPAAVAGS